MYCAGRDLIHDLTQRYVQNPNRLLGESETVEGALFEKVGHWAHVFGGYIMALAPSG